VYITRIVLRYPNGRLHEESLTTCGPLDAGSDFELYGHAWRVVGETVPRSRYDHAPVRFVCELAEAAAAAA
jgi:hypothetical protein